MSESIDAAALTPEERLHQAVKIWVAGAIRYAASQVNDRIQTEEYEDRDRTDSAESGQLQADAA